MVAVTGAWTRAEVEQFLHEQTVPLRLGCRTTDGVPWLIALWYRYADGQFRCATAADAQVVEYVDADPHVAFEVSTNEPPYKGVRGHGRVTLAPDDGMECLRELMVRYLGDTDSPLGEELLSESREEVALRIDPERLHSWDFTDRMGESESTDT